MDKKKLFKLLALIVLLGLCIGGYIWLDSYKSNEATKAKDTSKVLVDTTDDTIIEMSYTYKDKVVKLEYNSKKDKWFNVNNKDWPIDQSYTESMVNELAQVTATRTLERKEKPAEDWNGIPEIIKKSEQ